MLIDLRSDTVTRPTQAMRDFMHRALLGDDVYGEDPTVNELEARAAAYFGFEAGLYCPSGTMTNQVAIKTHTQPGDEIICDQTSHVYNYEGAGIAFNSGAQVRPIAGTEGKITAQQIIDHIQPDVINLPHTALVSLENTLNKAGGGYYTIAEIALIAEACKAYHLPLHLDGARVFNALVETGDKPTDYGHYFDSVSVCFSKGLGAPVGSVLLGSAEFIKKARRVRRVLGGGMRQAGCIAAGALYALEHHVERLSEDHRRAKAIGAALKDLPYVQELIPVHTNIIIFKLKEEQPSALYLEYLKKHGIVANTMGKQTIRFVTHLDFTDEMLERTLDAISRF